MRTTNTDRSVLVLGRSQLVVNDPAVMTETQAQKALGPTQSPGPRTPAWITTELQRPRT